MTEAERIKFAADVLEEQFGLCDDDADFAIGCAGCLASHLRRIMLDEPTPFGDKAFQAAMRCEDLVAYAETLQ